MRYLSLDLGSKHVGVAISHEGQIVLPLATVKPFQIVSVINQYHPDILVIGQPTSGPLFQAALTLKQNLEKQFSLKIILHPEDFSSRIGAQKLVEGNFSRSKRQNSRHQAAAAVILQDFLDSLCYN